MPVSLTMLSTKSRGYWNLKHSRNWIPIMKCYLFQLTSARIIPSLEFQLEKNAAS